MTFPAERGVIGALILAAALRNAEEVVQLVKSGAEAETVSPPVNLPLRASSREEHVGHAAVAEAVVSLAGGRRGSKMKDLRTWARLLNLLAAFPVTAPFSEGLVAVVMNVSRKFSLQAPSSEGLSELAVHAVSRRDDRGGI